ncbi:MAG: protease modulator HflC [Gammaproteobacteria bacterium]
MSTRQSILMVILTAILAIGWESFYIVKETERAVMLQLGELIDDDIQPGFGFKIPVLQNLRIFSARIQIVDLLPQTYLTKEKEVLEVDSYVTWQVDDAGTFYRRAAGNSRRLGDLLAARVDDTLRNQFGERGKWEAVSDERDDIMDALPTALNQQVRSSLGIKVIDVRIKRIELPEDARESVYRRMRAERQRLANEARAEGKEISEKIRANADKEREIMLAEAYRDAENMRGAGDAQAITIYNEVLQDKYDFYLFLKSLEAYRNSFSSRGDVLLLRPDSEFFKYFKQTDSLTQP